MTRGLAGAIWLREIETIEGIREWNKAKNFADTLPGTDCVTMPYQDRVSWVHRVG
ncbi:MAG: hypothetical protein Q7J29_03910 [Stagnimonas sp.]|nr:hypothetical protein [Stagnimonas sp.]